MVVNDVRDFAIFLHEERQNGCRYVVEQHLSNYQASRMLYVKLMVDWSYEDVNEWVTASRMVENGERFG